MQNIGMVRISKHCFWIRALIPPWADSSWRNSDRVKSGLQHLPTSSVLRSVLDIGHLGQTQDILGHNWFYYFSGLANLSSSVFQKEHWHIVSFLEEKYRNDSIWKISLRWKIEEKVNRSLSWSQNTSVRILFFLRIGDSRCMTAERDFSSRIQSQTKFCWKYGGCF